MSIRDKIKEPEELATILQRHKANGERVVTTNGCFDIIHVGHTRYLTFARSQGDVLAVALNTDRSVREIKGSPRPLLRLDERVRIVASLWMVDYVTWFDETDPCELLAMLKPDIHVKGGNYTIDQIIERHIVEDNGGKIVLTPNIPGNSTTNIISRVVERFS